MTDTTVNEDLMDEAAENTEPLSTLADSLVDRAVAHVARNTGRTVEEQWDRMGDGFSYQAMEMNPHQKQLDDYCIDGDTVDEDDTTTAECPECGNTVRVDDSGRATCYGTPEHGRHSGVSVIKPCGICGDPIRTAEICADCAEETDGDAFTPTWGTHRY